MSIVVNSTPLISLGLLNQYAKFLGLEVIGTLGVLLVGKQKGYIREIKPMLEKLVINDRYIGRALYSEILQKAGEL